MITVFFSNFLIQIFRRG